MGEQDAFAADVKGVTNIYEWRQQIEAGLRADFEASGMEPGQIRTELDKAVNAHPLYEAYLEPRGNLRTQWVIDNPRDAFKRWNADANKPRDDSSAWRPTVEQKKIMLAYMEQMAGATSAGP